MWNRFLLSIFNHNRQLFGNVYLYYSRSINLRYKNDFIFLPMKLLEIASKLQQIGRKHKLNKLIINSQYWCLQFILQSKKQMRKPLNSSWQPNIVRQPTSASRAKQFEEEDSLAKTFKRTFFENRERTFWKTMPREVAVQISRWLHQLNPGITKQKWGDDETKRLFQLHRKLGNRWSSIAEQLEGRTDNIVKNHFYSIVRRTITKINGILAKKKQIQEVRQMRPFSCELASKLILVSDGHYQLRVRLNSINLEESAKHILYQIIDLHEQIDSNTVAQDKIISLIVKMHEFRSNSKKHKRIRKSKQSMRFCQQAIEQHLQLVQSTDSSLLDDLSEHNGQIQLDSIYEDKSHFQLLQYSNQQISPQIKSNTYKKTSQISNVSLKCTTTESQNPKEFIYDDIYSSSITPKNSSQQQKGEQQLPIPLISQLQQKMRTQFTCIFTPICQDDWQFPQQVQGIAQSFCRYTSFIGLQATDIALRPTTGNLSP